MAFLLLRFSNAVKKRLEVYIPESGLGWRPAAGTKVRGEIGEALFEKGPILGASAGAVRCAGDDAKNVMATVGELLARVGRGESCTMLPGVTQRH